MNIVHTEHESVLRIKDIICLRSYTKRDAEKQPKDELNMRIGKRFEVRDDEILVDVCLTITTDDDSFESEIEMRGIFEFTGSLGADLEKKITEQNTIAILFPYIRSHMTLITAQPGMAPVVIPAINVNALINSEDQSDS